MRRDRAEDLERDEPIEMGVASFVNHAHPALPEPLDDDVVKQVLADHDYSAVGGTVSKPLGRRRFHRRFRQSSSSSVDGTSAPLPSSLLDSLGEIGRMVHL